MPGIFKITWAGWVAALVLAAAFFFLRAPARAAQADDAPDPFFSMTTQFVQPGQTFTVAVQFGTNVGMRATHFDLSFNPAVVRIDGVQAGAFLSDFAQLVGGSTSVTPGTIDNVHGTVTGFSDTLVGAPG